MPTDLPGTITHRLSEDGLTLTSTYTDPAGNTATSTVVWPDADTARAHYETALAAFEARAATGFNGRLGDPQRNGLSRIRRHRTRFGDLWFHISVGPPTWWLPNLQIRLRKTGTRPAPSLGCGWLRIAVEVGLDTRKKAAAT